MTVFSLDSSCMVAAVCSWHERHDAVAAAFQERRDRGARLVVAAHALVEAYAVLTRLPSPHRLAPADAWTLVRTNFAERADVATLSGAEHVELLERLAARSIGGGRTYDALIASAVASLKPAELLTLNPRHFHDLDAAVTIVDPGG